eukprot:g11880.t2
MKKRGPQNRPQGSPKRGVWPGLWAFLPMRSASSRGPRSVGGAPAVGSCRGPARFDTTSGPALEHPGTCGHSMADRSISAFQLLVLLLAQEHAEGPDVVVLRVRSCLFRKSPPARKAVEGPPPDTHWRCAEGWLSCRRPLGPIPSAHPLKFESSRYFFASDVSAMVKKGAKKQAAARARANAKEAEQPCAAPGDARKGVKGLKNLGNTCYVNSVIQCMHAAAEFRDSLPPGTGNSMCCSLGSVLRSLSGPGAPLVPPNLTYLCAQLRIEEKQTQQEEAPKGPLAEAPQQPENGNAAAPAAAQKSTEDAEAPTADAPEEKPPDAPHPSPAADHVDTAGVEEAEESQHDENGDEDGAQEEQEEEEGPFNYEILLRSEKTGKQDYGFKWNMSALQKDQLVIAGSTPESLVDRWNLKQHTLGDRQRMVRPGDRIIQVGEETTKQAMLKLLKQEQELTVLIQREDRDAPVDMPEIVNGKDEKEDEEAWAHQHWREERQERQKSMLDAWRRSRADLPENLHTMFSGQDQGTSSEPWHAMRGCDAKGKKPKMYATSKTYLCGSMPKLLTVQLKRFNKKLQKSLGIEPVGSGKPSKRLHRPKAACASAIDFGHRCGTGLAVWIQIKGVGLAELQELPVCEDENTKYELFGIVQHHGSTLQGGHYTAYVNLGPSQKEANWYFCNDAVVTKCSLEDVLKAETYVKAPWKRYVVAAFFVAYYSMSVKLWSDTVGQPHQWALEEQKRLIKEKAEAAKALSAADFYPLAGQKMYCNGQKNCPECHAIVHISHSECLACRDRKQNMRAINTHQACAEAMEADRKRKREAASDLISAMLDAQQAEESAADVRGDESGADGPADTVEDAEKRRRKLLEQAEELKKKQEESVPAAGARTAPVQRARGGDRRWSPEDEGSLSSVKGREHEESIFLDTVSTEHCSRREPPVRAAHPSEWAPPFPIDAALPPLPPLSFELRSLGLVSVSHMLEGWTRTLDQNWLLALERAKAPPPAPHAHEPAQRSPSAYPSCQSTASLKDSEARAEQDAAIAQLREEVRALAQERDATTQQLQDLRDQLHLLQRRSAATEEALHAERQARAELEEELRAARAATPGPRSDQLQTSPEGGIAEEVPDMLEEAEPKVKVDLRPARGKMRRMACQPSQWAPAEETLLRANTFIRRVQNLVEHLDERDQER